MIANFIKNEHPQTIAVILAHLNGHQAAETLAHLPDNLQTDVVLRIAKLETVSPDVVNELERALEEIKELAKKYEEGKISKKQFINAVKRIVKRYGLTDREIEYIIRKVKSKD
jgi:flagellar motor switch protein FliG